MPDSSAVSGNGSEAERPFITGVHSQWHAIDRGWNAGLVGVLVLLVVIVFP